MTVSAWSIPVIAVAVAAPAAAASGPVTDLSLSANAPTLAALPSSGGSSPLTMMITELSGISSSGPVAVYVTRLNGTNALPTVTDSFVMGASDGWTFEQHPDEFVFIYTNPIAAHSSTATMNGTWTTVVSPPGVVSGIATATLGAGSGGDTNSVNNQVSIPFATNDRLNLGAAAAYVVVGQLALTDDGATTVNGAIGFDPGASLTGFSTAAQAHYGSPAQNAKANSDTQSAYSNAAALAPDGPLPAALGGVTILPGVYYSAAALGLTGTLTFDARGRSTAQFILQTAGAMNTAAGSEMVLTGGAQASNIFWVTTGAITLGANSTFIGTALTNAAVTIGIRAQLTGRMLATNGAITLSSNPIQLP